MKQEGDEVRKAEPLVEIITDKATFELESPASGVLRRIAAPSKSVVPAGYIIGLIGKREEALPEVDAANRKLIEKFRRAAKAGAASGGQGGPVPRDARGERVRATPAARRLARERGADLNEVAKKLGGRAITEDDVRRFITGGGQ